MQKPLTEINKLIHRIKENSKIMKKDDKILNFSAIWSIVLFSVFFFYEESVLHFAADGSYFGLGLLYIFLFSLCFGILARLIAAIIPQKIRKILYPLIGFIICFIYATEFFIKKSLQTFISITEIGTGTGDVVGGFSDMLLHTVISGFYMIILFFLPFIIYCFFSRKYHPTPLSKKHKIAMPFISAGAIALACGIMFAIPNDRHIMTDEYFFNRCVSRIGLSPSLIADIFHIQSEDSDKFTLINEAENEKVKTDPNVEYNKTDIDFSERAKTESNSVIRSIDEYVAALSPSEKNEYTGLFKGKNLILITAEAFSAEVIDKERTPALYRMATKGIVFKDYYQPAWGGSTSSGEYSILTGLIPTSGVKSIRKTVGVDMSYTIGNQLRKEGYFSAAYHNGDYTYYSRHKTHCNLGYDTFTGMGNGLEKGVTVQWPQSDLEMIDYTVPQYIDKQPFSIYYMTVSGHCLYNFSGNAMSEKNKELFKDSKEPETIRAYYAAQQELEFAMESLLKQLEEKNISDDTVIVISTDHYPYGLEKSPTWGTDRDYLVDLYGKNEKDPFIRDHSALIIWSGCLENQSPIVVDTPTYSVDILPTLSNLFGIAYDSRLLVGRDVFSKQEPLVIFTDYSFITDKGSYLSSTGVFTPEKDVKIPDGYVDRIKTIIKNKMVFSKNVISSNYYHTLK